MKCSEPLLVMPDGVLVTRTNVAKLEHFGAFPLLEYLRNPERRISLAVQQGDEHQHGFLGTLGSRDQTEHSHEPTSDQKRGKRVESCRRAREWASTHARLCTTRWLGPNQSLSTWPR